MKKIPPQERPAQQEDEPLFSFRAVEEIQLPVEIPHPESRPIKRHAPVAEWPRIVQLKLADALDQHYCPALFLNYQQDAWREQFIRPVVNTLTPIVMDAVSARRGKGVGDALERAVYRALRWMQERMTEEFLHHVEDTLEERRSRWLREIDAMVALPTYARKKDTSPDFVLALRYEAILRWCRGAAERRRLDGMLRWMLRNDVPRPQWWPPSVNLEEADWSTPGAAACDILGQMCGLGAERINAIVKKTRRTLLTTTVRAALEQPRPRHATAVLSLPPAV